MEDKYTRFDPVAGKVIDTRKRYSDTEDMYKPVIVDCQHCQNQYYCCRAVRVELDPKEVGQYETEPALRDRKGIHVVAKQNGVCFYFDAKSKGCKIWDRRPRICRIFDCDKDPRIDDILSGGILPPLVREGQQFKVSISVAALDKEDERHVLPMALRSKVGQTAVEMVTVIGRGRSLVENVQRMVEKTLREQLGEAFEETIDDEDS